MSTTKQAEPPKKKQGFKGRMTDAERITFAKQIEEFYEVSHADLKKILLQAFLKGAMTALGAVIGGTILLALLLWGLSRFNNLPFVGGISKAAENSLQRGQK